MDILTASQFETPALHSRRCTNTCVIFEVMFEITSEIHKCVFDVDALSKGTYSSSHVIPWG
jgi:hypothetical protein